MASLDIYSSLNLQIGQHKHRFYLGYNLLEAEDLIGSNLTSGKVCVVTNAIVAKYHLPKLEQSLKNFEYDILMLPDGEEYKNIETLNYIYDFLINNNYRRDSTIIALGGGVVGDIVAFAASTYQRGVRLIHMPTTLLSQVDSAIGGKTAINHQLGKNMIGSFYFPHTVIADIATLQTLPSRELRAGLGEVIKYGLIEGGDFLIDLSRLFAKDIKTQGTLVNEERGRTIKNFNPDNLINIITKCVLSKVNIVNQDVNETKGTRQLLNLGHTFAHGIETITHYKKYLHGEAVAIGLYLAAKLSYHMHYLNKNELDFVDELLKTAGLPNRLPTEIDIQQLKQIMLRDKKSVKNTLPFVLIKKFGHCVVDFSVTESLLNRALA